MRRRIIAVLNCYAPNGANRAQVILRTAGPPEILGDTSLAGAALKRFQAPANAGNSAASARPDPDPTQ
jgi:hypothetical protein